MAQQMMETPLVTQTIYLDYQATTPLANEVMQAMQPYWQLEFGNAHSALHDYGWRAAEGVAKARAQIAKLIGAKTHEIIFTSGATESNNLALKGAMLARRKEGRLRLITLETEHKCVLASAARLAEQGFLITKLGVRADGLIDLEGLAKAMGEDVALVSVMAAHNEIGTIQPLAEIAALCRQFGAWFHSDGAQAFGKIPLAVDKIPLDLLSISGHKIYGPKGIGALYIRSRNPRVELIPMMDGGGQERGLRSGTLPVSLCVGLGAAAELAMTQREKDWQHQKEYSQLFCQILRDKNIAFSLNGTGEAGQRLVGNLNLCFDGIEENQLLAKLPRLALSTGSACSSANPQASHVLKALGHQAGRMEANLRISFGRNTSRADVELAAHELASAVNDCRS